MNEKLKPKNVKMPEAELEDLEDLIFPDFKFKKKNEDKINIIVNKKKSREGELF